MNVTRVSILLLGFGFHCLTACGHTPAESNAVVRAVLVRAVANSSQGPQEVLDYDPATDPGTWSSFLLQGESGGWSLDEMQAAFDNYLLDLGTKDCSTLKGLEKACAWAAINCCKVYSLTSSVAFLKGIALNERGIYRDRAIESALAFGEVSGEMTTFVETIVTNTLSYSRSERGMACSMYSRRVRETVSQSGYVTPLCARAAVMFYNNRERDVVGAASVDMVLLACMPEYANSSNRLHTALFVLDQEGGYMQTRRYFTSVTNELLSSGQPLRQLNIGEDAE